MKTHVRGVRLDKTPTIARLFAITALLTPSLGVAQGPSWTADAVVEQALANPGVEATLASRLRAVRAEVELATVVPNPTLGLAHEQILGAEAVASRETSLSVAQSLDLSGRRGELRRAQADREAAVRAEQTTWRLDVATAVRTDFYAVRYHQARVSAFDAWVVQLEEGVATMTARADRGDASPYAVRRVGRELETARARRAAEGAEVAEAWAALCAWASCDDRPTLEGGLVPDPPALDEPNTAEPAPLPGVLRLEHQARALELEQGAWGSPFWRDWTVSAGYRLAETGGQTGHGVLLGLSVPLTLWNPDAPRVDALRAAQAEVAAELSLLRPRAERARDAAEVRLQATLAALDTLSAPAHDAELTTMAERAFAAGESTLTELLDAYESETELHLSRIDLRWQARRAAIELDRRRGLGAQ